jgi:lactocepin
MGVATQNGYWDALAGAALCGKKGSVLVLVDKEDSASIKGFAGKHSDYITTGYIFGGELAISPDVEKALKAATPKPGMPPASEGEVTFLTL